MTSTRTVMMMAVTATTTTMATRFEPDVELSLFLPLPCEAPGATALLNDGAVVCAGGSVRENVGFGVGVLVVGATVGGRVGTADGYLVGNWVGA